MITHQRRNGAYEHFAYDSRGLLTVRWNPLVGIPTAPDPAGPEPKTTISYYPVGDAWQDRVKSITDPRTNVTTYEYESSGGVHVGGRGLVSKVIFPGNKYRSYVYDPSGNLTHEENELRQPTEYVYDEYSRLLQLKVAHPNADNPAIQDTGTPWDTTIYNYTPATGGPLSLTARAATTITTAMNVITLNVYDDNLRLLNSTRDPNTVAALTQYHYDPAGNQDWMIDPDNHQTTTGFDPRNRPQTVTSAPTDVAGVPGKVALVTQMLYDPAGNVRKIIQPDNQEQTKTYDALNRLGTDTRPVSPGHTRTTNYEYFPSGMLKSLLDPKHQLTQFEYDERDLKTKVTYPDSSIVQGWLYDKAGNLTQRPTVGGPKQLFTYDERNRPTHMRWDNAIDWSDFIYDDASRLQSAANPYSTVTRGYDVAGRLILDQQALAPLLNTLPNTIAPLSVVSRKVHPGVGAFDINLPLTGAAGVECRSGGLTQDYTMVLSFSGPVAAVGGASVGSGFATVGSVSATGTDVTVNLTGVSDSQRLTVNVYGIRIGATTGQVTVPMNVIVGDVNGDGVVNIGDVNYVKSQSGSYPSSSTFRADLNVDGAINIGDITVVKRSSGATVPFAPGYTVTVSYGHDGDGRVNHLYVPEVNGGYSYLYSYDGMGRLEKIFDSNDPNPHYQYTYDAASNVLNRRTFLNGTSQSFVPDELNRIKQRTIQAAWYDAYPNGRHDYDFSVESYSYDKMSRLSATDRTLRAPDGTLDVKEDTFGYNYAGELTGASYGNGGHTVSYTLDDAGNRTLVEDNIYGTAGFTPNSLNQYLETTNGSQHEIASAYYVNYHYLGDTQLASASRSSSDKYELGYDALGRCVRRRTNGQTIYYIYDGSRAIVEYNPGDGSSPTRNVYGLGIDEIILRNSFDHPRFLQQDRLGSTSAVLDDLTGAVVEQYRYDAFGAPEVRTGPVNGNPLGTVSNTGTLVNNRYLFTGREWVQRYGFYEYRARAYNPNLGRFMSEDPLGFGGRDTNLFRYCGNDPVNLSDAYGLWPFPDGFDFLDGVQGAIQAGVGSAVNTVLLRKHYTNPTLGGAGSYGIPNGHTDPGPILDAFWDSGYREYRQGNFDNAIRDAVRETQSIRYDGRNPDQGAALGPDGGYYDDNGYGIPWFDNLPADDSPLNDQSINLENAPPGTEMAYLLSLNTSAGRSLNSGGSRDYEWATTAGFGGGGDYSFAPGGGGRISHWIEEHYTH